MNGETRRRSTLKTPVAAALLLTAVALFPAAPAAAAGAGEDGDGRRVVMVEKVEAKDGERTPVVLTRLLGGGYLGVELVDLTPELRAHFGVPADRGVMIARIREDSPASRAGLQVGDVVTAVDGEAVASPWDLSAAIRGREAGETADLEVWRDRRALDFAVTVDERQREQIDLGRLLHVAPGEMPGAIRLRDTVTPGEVPEIVFDPQSVERFTESLEKIDWPRFQTQVESERNRELETRLRELEERLRQLEEELRGSRNDR